MPTGPLILASRSPQRLACLRQLLPGEPIEVIPPSSADEPGVDDCGDWPAIERRLAEIARSKADDVRRQIADRPDAQAATVIAADTVIIAPDPRQGGRLTTLGQPPDIHWQDTVRQWFRELLLDQTHTAATALCVDPSDGPRRECVVRTEVTFGPADERLIEWYIGTGEPRGKAGGYGIQGAGEVFVREVRGSLSNVVGLPQRELLDVLCGRDHGLAAE
jgi:septum formation protein